jgi:hypothetical protein
MKNVIISPMLQTKTKNSKKKEKISPILHMKLRSFTNNINKILIKPITENAQRSFRKREKGELKLESEKKMFKEEKEKFAQTQKNYNLKLEKEKLEKEKNYNLKLELEKNYNLKLESEKKMFKQKKEKLEKDTKVYQLELEKIKISLKKEKGEVIMKNKLIKKINSKFHEIKKENKEICKRFTECKTTSIDEHTKVEFFLFEQHKKELISIKEKHKGEMEKIKKK